MLRNLVIILRGQLRTHNSVEQSHTTTERHEYMAVL